MKNANGHKTPIDLISRFLSGEATKKESDLLNLWISESPDNTRIFEEYRKVWEKTGVLQSMPSFDLDYEWGQFQTLVHPPKKEPETWNFLAGPRFFGSFYRMAAVIAIGLVLGYSIYYLKNQVSTQTFLSLNGREKIELPDGSVITMNKGSEISYPKHFSQKNRLVSFSGEAFFQVQKDSLRPFIIRANSLSIRVLGTSFNVKAKPGSPEIEVIVNTGRVALYQGSDRVNEKSIVAGERAVFNTNKNKISVFENTNTNFLAWETGKMVFEGNSLSEVLDVLSSVYHVSFIVKSESLKNCRITVSFDNQELKAVFKVLEATLDVHFNVNSDSIELSGQGC